MYEELLLFFFLNDIHAKIMYEKSSTAHSHQILILLILHTCSPTSQATWGCRVNTVDLLIIYTTKKKEVSLTCISFINSVPNIRHRDDLGHHWQPRLISHSVSTVPPQAVCTPYYSLSSIVTSESASISANFIAFGFDCIAWQYDSQENWTEYEIRDEFFFFYQ